MDEVAELRQEIKRDFRDFLEHDFGHSKYAQQIQDILKHYPTTHKLRLEVDLQGSFFLLSLFLLLRCLNSFLASHPPFVLHKPLLLISMPLTYSILLLSILIFRQIFKISTKIFIARL